MRLTVDLLDDLRVADRKGRVTLGSKYAGRRFSMREEPDGTAILTPVVVVSESEQPFVSRRVVEDFAALEALRDNWDGRGSIAPAPALIGQAREVLAMLHAGVIARGAAWTDPNIGSNERGQVIMEWWHDNRSLTVFVRSAGQVDYLRAWGRDIEAEMEDGKLERLDDFVEQCRWLCRQEALQA